MTIYRERVTKLNLSAILSYAAGWTLRVWREEPHDKMFVASRTTVDLDIYSALDRHIQNPVSQFELAKAILALDRVNAVEITDMAGFGEVVCKDAP